MTQCILNNMRTTAFPGSIYIADCEIIVYNLEAVHFVCIFLVVPMRVTRIASLGHIPLVTMQRAVKSLTENKQENDKRTVVAIGHEFKGTDQQHSSVRLLPQYLQIPGRKV